MLAASFPVREPERDRHEQQDYPYPDEHPARGGNVPAELNPADRLGSSCQGEF